MINVDYQVYVPYVIFVIFSIIGNIFMIKESKENVNGIHDLKILRKIGITNIIFICLTLFFPPNSNYFGEELENIYNFLPPMCLTYIPSLITYGILMYKLGKMIEERWGYYLKIAGIIGIVANSFLLPFPITILFITALPPLAFNMIAMTLSFIAGILCVIEYFFIYLNGKKNDNRNFKNSGIFLIFGFLIQLILTVILTIIYSPLGF